MADGGVRALRGPFELTIAVADGFFSIRFLWGKSVGKHMLPNRAFFQKAFRRTLRFFRFKWPTPLADRDGVTPNTTLSMGVGG